MYLEDEVDTAESGKSVSEARAGAHGAAGGVGSAVRVEMFVTVLVLAVDNARDESSHHA